MAAIFDNSRWLPFMSFNMALITPRHLYVNLKFSKISEFSEVRLPVTLYRSCKWIHVYGNSHVDSRTQ